MATRKLTSSSVAPAQAFLQAYSILLDWGPFREVLEHRSFKRSKVSSIRKSRLFPGTGAFS